MLTLGVNGPLVSIGTKKIKPENAVSGGFLGMCSNGVVAMIKGISVFLPPAYVVRREGNVFDTCLSIHLSVHT